MQLWVGGALMFSAGGLYAWSAVIPAIQAAYSSTAEQAGMVFSFAILSFAVVVFLVPRAGGKLLRLRGGGIFGAAGAAFLGIAATAPNFFVFLAAFSLGFGSASGGVYIVVLDMAGRSRLPRLMVPVMVASFGLGGAIFGPLLRLLVEEGAGLASLAAVALPLIFASALAIAARSEIESENKRTAVVGGDEVPASWHRIVLIWFIFCLGSMGGLMTLGLATSIVETRGASILLSSATLTGIAIGNTSGRLAVGVLGRWMLPRSIFDCATIVTALGIGLAWNSSRPELVCAGLVLIAAGYGLVASGIPTLVRALFGAARFGRMFSFIYTAWGVAGLTSPWLAGWIFDRWGDYRFAFMFAMAATIMAFFLSVGLGKNRLGDRFPR